MARRRSRTLPRAFVAVHLVLVLIPIGIIAVWAFADSWPWPDLVPPSLSLRGIQQVLFSNHGAGLQVMAQSVGIALATAVLTTTVAVLAARSLCHYSWFGRDAFHFALMIPFLIPITVFAMGVQVFFIKIGVARTVFGVVLAHSIVALPYAVTIMVDVTKAAGTRLEEAAKSLGAGPLSMVRQVTIPALLPGILSALSMSYILSFSQYFLTLLVGGGSVRTFAVIMFPYLSGGDRTIASAYGLLFIVATFVVFLFFEWLLRRFGFRENKDMFSL